MAGQQIGPSTIVDEVVGRMREMLLSGEFEAGERMRLRDLQARFGVSHIPIREALRILEGEGLVENLPQRGAVAVPISLELLEEVYDARRLLEPAIGGRAAGLFTDDDLAELEAAHLRLEAAGASSDEAFFDAHRDFHWLTLRPGANDTLERMLRQLWGVAERFVRLSMAFPSDVEPAMAQHREIYKLSSERDPAVADVIAEHLHLTEDALRAHHARGTEAP